MGDAKSGKGKGGKPRSKAELAGVSTAHMTEREYDLTNDSKTYLVITGKGTRITVKGIHSARAVAGDDGTFTVKG
jgi:hypothetical protein